MMIRKINGLIATLSCFLLIAFTPSNADAIGGKLFKFLFKRSMKIPISKIPKKTINRSIFKNLPAKNISKELRMPKSVIEHELMKNYNYYRRIGVSSGIVKLGLVHEAKGLMIAESIGLDEPFKLAKFNKSGSILIDRIWRKLDVEAIGGHFGRIRHYIEKENIDLSYKTELKIRSKKSEIDRLHYTKFDFRNPRKDKKIFYKTGDFVLKEGISNKIESERHKSILNKKKQGLDKAR